MRIYLLTHERELNKATNTGALALDVAGAFVERIAWQRTKPNQEILKLTKTNNIMLLYPTDNNSDVAAISDFENLIIIDSTWQESRKILNKSEYLNQMPSATITASNSSKYRLRRNQVPGGLCTAECVIEALKLKGIHGVASKLQNEYERFNRFS